VFRTTDKKLAKAKRPAMRSESIVSLFTILVIGIGIAIAAVAASTHGSASTVYTSLIIGFGVMIVFGFAIAAFILNGRSRRMQSDLR
jgi:hypothetical protein